MIAMQEIEQLRDNLRCTSCLVHNDGDIPRWCPFLQQACPLRAQIEAHASLPAQRVAS